MARNGKFEMVETKEHTHECIECVRNHCQWKVEWKKTWKWFGFLIVFCFVPYFVVAAVIRSYWMSLPTCTVQNEAIEIGERPKSGKMQANDRKYQRKWHRCRHFAFLFVELHIWKKKSSDSMFCNAIPHTSHTHTQPTIKPETEDNCVHNFNWNLFIYSFCLFSIFHLSADGPTSLHPKGKTDAKQKSDMIFLSVKFSNQRAHRIAIQ